MKALLGNDTSTLLSIVLDRLYVLRNQLIHGGATWNGASNRAQVKDGAAILAVLLPIIIELMMKGEKDEFDAITYPLT
jgi:hypothetical protein